LKQIIERKRDNDNGIIFKQANRKLELISEGLSVGDVTISTLFPSFVFTSGLATTRTKKIKHKNRDSRLIKRALVRAVKLNLIGITYNNLIP
ncbi:hypothetical protein PSHT_06058, partial [Puccinia striiformis]